ncbi:ABC transporter substrate-binding protein [Dactylosporangium sp. AC04546]|uniref:ABC transporter substrate-binding protein n=1 Tax=Dactylosporangium sp. AC04546 TaxID=2862460 RepID=UPI001EE00836|nr:ABC transporter substrate-binding protein [Dactylosporangium sp. AC04546]WVK78583.1 ABC transporter substrate-binding protein [Dactylosporangium sp. AC04546]
MRTRRSHKLIVGIVAVLATMAATSCSTGSSDKAEAGGGADQIVAAADPSLLPYNFLDTDGKTWKGLNVDIAAALSDKLGRRVVFQSAGFDTIIPGLTSGRFDVALTGMFDTKERQKTVDFVDYLTAKNNFLTRTGYRDIESMDDLCGIVVGIPGGALEADLLAKASDACVKAGKKTVDVKEFADLDATVLALLSSRIDVTPNDSAANAYITSQNTGKVKVSGGYLNEGYFAVAFPKSSALTAEFETAFKAIIADGTYGRILTDWGIADRAVPAPIINGSPF